MTPTKRGGECFHTTCGGFCRNLLADPTRISSIKRWPLRATDAQRASRGCTCALSSREFARALAARDDYSTVTDLARLRGLSTSVPRASAAWYASNCTGIACTIGDSTPTWRGVRITCTCSD